MAVFCYSRQFFICRKSLLLFANPVYRLSHTSIWQPLEQIQKHIFRMLMGKALRAKPDSSAAEILNHLKNCFSSPQSDFRESQQVLGPLISSFEFVATVDMTTLSFIEQDITTDEGDTIIEEEHGTESYAQRFYPKYSFEK